MINSNSIHVYYSCYNEDTALMHIKSGGIFDKQFTPNFNYPDYTATEEQLLFNLALSEFQRFIVL